MHIGRPSFVAGRNRWKLIVFVICKSCLQRSLDPAIIVKDSRAGRAYFLLFYYDDINIIIHCHPRIQDCDSIDKATELSLAM
jgi:hypothetical protein